MMITGIWFVLRVGLPWRDLPEQFGPWSSVYTRFRRWCYSGLWSELLEILSQEACSSIRSIDCSHIKVHQHASYPAGGADAQAIGPTKVGSNTRLSAVVDGLGRAVGLDLAPGNRNDQRAVTPLFVSSSTAGWWPTADSTPASFVKHC